MGIEIFGCSVFLASAIVLTFCCGVAWESRHEDGWEKDGIRWAVLFGFLALIFYIASSVLWVELGAMKVETKEMPVVERKITQKVCNGVIESDTLYVFKFE